MKFEGRELKDWQEQVWDAKRRIYERTKDQGFEAYLEDIREGARAFRAEQESNASNNVERPPEDV